MSKSRLTFAAGMAVTSAIYTIPYIVLFYFLDKRDDLISKLFNLFLTLISLGLFLMIYLTLKKLLTTRFHFSAANTLITFLIVLNIIASIFTILFSYVATNGFWMILNTILFIFLNVILGVLLIALGIRLLKLPDNPFGLFKAYSYTIIIAGLSFVLVCCFPIGYLASSVSDAILGIVFYQAASEEIPLESAPSI